MACLQRMLEVSSLEEALKRLFYGAVSDNHEGRGCLLVNCASSSMREEAAEQALLRSGFECMFAIVESRVRKAQENADIPKSVEAAEVATLICATLSGLRVFQKSGMPKNKLKKTADLSIKLLMQQG